MAGMPPVGADFGVGSWIELGPGGYVAYPGDLPHVSEALVENTMAFIAMDHIPMCLLSPGAVTT